MPIKPTNRALKKFRHPSYKVSGTKLHPKKALPDRKCQGKNRTSKIDSDSSSEQVPPDCNYKIREVGYVNSQDPFVCSLYITSAAYDSQEDPLVAQINIDPFADTLHNIASGKIRLQQTYCGVIVASTREDDASKIVNLPWQDIFGIHVLVSRFQTGNSRFRQNLILQDVPWCISNMELHQALKKQGIAASKIIRTRSNVKIELLSFPDVHRLIEEGLNFFNYTSFPAVMENSVNQDESDIIQCFRCQGFWHTSLRCRQMARCVRCGENHDVGYCPRPRNAAVCCHCRGPHHAAYKKCPVRLQHINSSVVAFQIAKTKSAKSFPQNML